MEYRRLEESWQDAEKVGDIEGAMDLLEKQIGDNLLAVRNGFAEEPSNDPDAAFGLLFEISDIKPEYRDVVQEFCNLGEALVDIKLDREISAGHNIEGNYIVRYVALEEQIESAMNRLMIL